MSTFQEIPANNLSLFGRKPIYGIGINDADYQTNHKINGKKVGCPFYVRWHSMIVRCYSAKSKAKYPTYIGCSVCDEWLTFSNFKEWMVKQDWEGKQIDKDILVQGNKVYSPETCLFVSSQINSLFLDKVPCRGAYPRGVSFNKPRKMFFAICSVRGKHKHIGCYTTSEEAHEAYKTFKYNLIAEIAVNQQEPLRSAMLAYRIN